MKNPAFEDTYIKVTVFKKGTDSIIQIIRKTGWWIWGSPYEDCDLVRSYQTEINNEKPAPDNDFGDLIVADFDFNGLDDFAFLFGSGGSSGPNYLYYTQQPDGRFIRQSFLDDIMIFFPSVIDKDRKRLISNIRVDVTKYEQRTFQWDSNSSKWYFLSSEIIKD